MNVLCIGAHPDDAEFHAGGAMIKWARAGHRVAAVSLTNGDIGHHEMAGGPLASRRREEVRRSAQLADIEHRVLDCHDGELMPTLEARKTVVRLIREFEAGAVLTHRPNDYHPDHRYAATLVQDAAFMVTVPHFCPGTKALRQNPAFFCMMDQFTKPVPFQADVAVAIDDVMELKWAMLDAMSSQFYEWLPWLEGRLEQVPKAAGERRQWLEETWTPLFSMPAQMARAVLEQGYGAAAADVVFAELFEICEYGRPPSRADLSELFPFIPNPRGG